MSKCWICGKEMTKTIGGCEHCKDCGTGYNDLVFRPQNGTIDPHKIVENGTVLRDSNSSLSGTAIHFTCDSCGREIFGCTFVNGMKFCAKCYQETFGKTNKDRQIAELQKQLKEKEKEILTRTIDVINDFTEQLYKSERAITGTSIACVRLWDVEGVIQNIIKKYNITQEDIREHCCDGKGNK